VGLGVDQLLRVNGSPRAAALRMRQPNAMERALAPLLFAVAAIVACALLDAHDLGVAACTVALWALGTRAIKQDRLAPLLHLTAGVLALGLLRDAATAGAFAPAACVLVLGTLVSRDPLVSANERAFAAGGLVIGVVLVLVPSDPVLKIIGVACLPLALRAFVLQGLSPQQSSALWNMVALLHVAAVVAFVPAHGALAAAWVAVLAEVMLLAGAAVLLARNAGMLSRFPQRTLAMGGGGLLLLCALAVPGTGAWPLLVTTVVAAIIGVFYWPART